jgi:hypothetical protein
MNPVALGGSVMAAILDRPTDLATQLFRGDAGVGLGTETGQQSAARDLISLSPAAQGLLSGRHGGAGAADIALGDTAVGQVARQALRAISDDLTHLVNELGFSDVAKGFVQAFIQPAFDALRDGGDFSGSMSVFSAERATVVSSGAVATAQSLFANTIEIDIASDEGSVSIRVSTIRFESVSIQSASDDFLSASALADALRDVMSPMLNVDDVFEAAEEPSGTTVEAAVLEAFDPHPDDEGDESGFAVPPSPDRAADKTNEDGARTVESESLVSALARAAADDTEADAGEQDGQAFEARYRLTAAYRFNAEDGTTITRIRVEAIVDLRAASVDKRAAIDALLRDEQRPTSLNAQRLMEPLDA